jgi:hypothetical protein
MVSSRLKDAPGADFLEEPAGATALHLMKKSSCNGTIASSQQQFGLSY